MSLLSKTIPRSWAKGTINSGFLATEAGTAARSVGDVLISGAATFVGFSHLLNATFMPMLILVSITIILTRQCYYALVEADEEDDESEGFVGKKYNPSNLNDTFKNLHDAIHQLENFISSSEA